MKKKKLGKRNSINLIMILTILDANILIFFYFINQLWC